MITHEDRTIAYEILDVIEEEIRKRVPLEKKENEIPQDLRVHAALIGAIMAASCEAVDCATGNEHASQVFVSMCLREMMHCRHVIQKQGGVKDAD